METQNHLSHPKYLPEAAYLTYAGPETVVILAIPLPTQVLNEAY